MGKVDIVLTADPIRERKFVVVPQKNESVSGSIFVSVLFMSKFTNNARLAFNQAPKDLNALCDLASSMTKYHPVATVYGDDSTAEQMLLKAIKEDPDAARPYLILSRRSARERVMLPTREKVSRIQLVLMAIERNGKNNEAWAELFSRMKDGEIIKLLDGEVLSREDVLCRARGIGYSSYRLEKALAWSQLGGDVQQRYKHLRKAVAIASQGLGWRSLYRFMSENRIVEEPVKVGNEEVYLVDFPFRQLNLDPFRKSSWAFAKDWYKKLQTSTLSNLIESFKMWPLLMQGRMLDLDPTCLDLPEGEARTLTLPSGQTITRLEWCARVVIIKPNITGLSALLREMTTDNVHSVALPNGKTITKDDIMQRIRQNRESC